MAGARKGKGEGKIGRARNARSEGEGKRKRLQLAHCLFELRSFRQRVVSPTTRSPTSQVDSPTS